MATKECYGIDLGTTFSAIGRYDEERRLVDIAELENADGRRILRSAVYYEEGGNIVVGDTAVNAARQYPDRVITNIKRAMGSDWKKTIDEQKLTPAKVSAEILKALKRDGETYFSKVIEDVVITVPAYFGDAQRFATEEAAKEAGLNVIRLLTEPCAAALAFAIDQIEEIAGKNILVYDLGGGTFDVTLIQPKHNGPEKGIIALKIGTLLKDGDRELGGTDWNEKLIEFVAQRCKEQYDFDPQLEPVDEAILKENCEKAKRDLSRAQKVSILCDTKGHQVEVNREKFEELTLARLEETKHRLENVLKQAEDKGIKRDKISVLLCGGATAMPMVEKMITEVMGKPPLRHRHPELLVVRGAAYAAFLGQEVEAEPEPGEEKEGIPKKEQSHIVVKYKGKDTKIQLPPEEGLTDVGKPIGVEVIDESDPTKQKTKVACVIENNAPTGEIYEKPFYTISEGQTEVDIVIHEAKRENDGNEESLDRWERLAKVSISGLPPARPAGKEVRVRLRYDESGIIRGNAWDVETNEEVAIEIDRKKIKQ
ncbi:MAG TPA: Hsp70 family protein [bacterium (Candidatus Stahlbacteria)]|nr:Hsp70 family protein [Candidatus Stahlbacteria bacterium]